MRTINYSFDTPFAGQTITGEIEVEDSATEEDNCGYTPDLNQAGVYTELKPGYHDSEDTVPVPVSFIRELRVRRVIDPGDSLNSAFHSAKSLRALLAAASAEGNGNG